jgi:hypothetical protein
MSDHDEIPHASTRAAPETSRRWNEEDSRTLVIAFVGGLAANVGVVILVGLAVAFVHLGKGHPLGTASLAYSLVFVAIATVSFVRGNALRRQARTLGIAAAGQAAVLGRLWIVAGSLAALLVVLMWTGVAAGVK